MMPRSERSVYTALDFIQWRESNTLSLTPKFQRRGVWTPAARSFFIDSLLREMPVPPIYIRVIQSPERNRAIREVVDGQQRISAVLDFVDGTYRLSRSLQGTWAGKVFDKLSDDERNRIRSYGFSAEVFHGISDLEVLELFSRLNTYSVPLNAQELRNGKFFGFFKQTAYALAYEHLEFWRKHGAFTERNIARMLEVEFVSEMMIAQLAGMQDKKKSIDAFYGQYDAEFKERTQVERRFRDAADEINEVFDDHLRETEFRRPPLLYTLFCVLHHRRYGLSEVQIKSPKRALNKEERLSLKEAVDFLSEKIELARTGDAVPQSYQGFVAACLRQTDNIQPRQERFTVLYRKTFA